MYKKRPCAYIALKYSMDGTNLYYDKDRTRMSYEICYKCSTCDKLISGYNMEQICERCGTVFDWGKSEPRIKVTRTIEWE